MDSEHSAVERAGACGRGGGGEAANGVGPKRSATSLILSEAKDLQTVGSLRVEPILHLPLLRLW